MAAMAVGRVTRAARALDAARRARVGRRAAEECSLMLMLHAGYPCALESLRLLKARWPGAARRTREGSPALWRRRGAALCRRVYGPAYARLIPAVSALHPDLAVWMEEHGYGRVLSRPGLTSRSRELLTVSSLAALGWEPQLVSHVLGARRLGATPAQVLAALAVGAAEAAPAVRAVAERAAVHAGARR
jgi:4-carboxymuconolactone decarboxylase